MGHGAHARANVTEAAPAATAACGGCRRRAADCRRLSGRRCPRQPARAHSRLKVASLRRELAQDALLPCDAGVHDRHFDGAPRSVGERRAAGEGCRGTRGRSGGAAARAGPGSCGALDVRQRRPVRARADGEVRLRRPDSGSQYVNLHCKFSQIYTGACKSGVNFSQSLARAQTHSSRPPERVAGVVFASKYGSGLALGGTRHTVALGSRRVQAADAEVKHATLLSSARRVQRATSLVNQSSQWHS